MQRKILSALSAVIFTFTATVTVYAESAEKLCYLENTDNSGIGVSAVSAILIEADTGTVLFSKKRKRTQTDSKHDQDNDCSAYP